MPQIQPLLFRILAFLLHQGQRLHGARQGLHKGFGDSGLGTLQNATQRNKTNLHIFQQFIEFIIVQTFDCLEVEEHRGRCLRRIQRGDEVHDRLSTATDYFCNWPPSFYGSCLQSNVNVMQWFQAKFRMEIMNTIQAHIHIPLNWCHLCNRTSTASLQPSESDQCQGNVFDLEG